MSEPSGRQHWPDLPAGQRPLPGTRLWRTLRTLRRRGGLTVRRLGCAVLVLALLVVTGLVLLDRAVDGVTALFGDEPEPVPGDPFDSVAPDTPPSSGSEVIDRITRRGKIIVAVQENPGLAERVRSGEWTGFDIALLGLIARDLGVELSNTDFVPLASSSREAALLRGEVDLVLGGYAITEERRAEVGLVGPYLRTPQRLAVPAGQADGLAPLRDGTVCAVEDSPTAAALAPRLGDRLVTRGGLDTCAALLGSRVDAVAGDELQLAGVLAEDPGTLRLSGPPLGETGYGVGLAPGDDVLADRVRRVLRNAVEDGTWARLYAEHLGTPVPPAPPLGR